MSKRVIFDCERMKYPNTGLYEFCWQLGSALRAEADTNLETIDFYLPKKIQNELDSEKNNIVQHSFHKFFFPPLKKVDIWHSTFQGSMYYPSNLKAKVVLTIHDLNFMYELHVSESKKKRYLEKLQKKVDRADYIVAISKYVLSDIEKYLSIKGKSIKVIYNGCNLDDLIPEVPVGRVLNKPFLFTIGTILPKKNFHVLPRLIQNNDFELIISGLTLDEEYKKKVWEEAFRLGVADRVFLTGPVSENDKKWYLKNCTAFVFPSIAEGFGLPVIEAMHYGKPVLLSTHTSLPEVGGNCAFYFEDFDPVNMQAVLDKSLKYYHEHSPANSIIERSKLFSWNKAAKEYIAIYRDILN